MADDKLADNEKLNSDESDESEDEDYVPSGKKLLHII